MPMTINGANFTVTADTLCNDGSVEKYFTGGAPSGWSLGALGSGGSGSDPTSTANLFSDSFESQDLSASAASVNNVNFQWTSGNRTSVLTQVDSSTARRVYPTAFIQDYTDGRDVTAKTGSYSLGVEYAANVEMAEQRFAFTARDEVWFRYWIRVPENFLHNSSSPSNHKFFALWMDDYSVAGVGSTLAWEFWNNGSGGSEMAVHYSNGNNTVMGPHLQQTQFISVPADRGRWMQVVMHIKAATTTESNDGVIEMWRRWEDESDFTKYHEVTDADMGIQGAVNGFSAGYLMGYANAPYAEDTWWIVDDFEMSTRSLL